MTDDRLIQIEVPRRLGDRLLAGLLERFLEALGQRVTLRAFVLERRLAQGFASSRLGRKAPLRVRQLGLVATLGLLVGNDAAEVQVDHHAGAAARAREVELALQVRHGTLFYRGYAS